MKRKLLVLMMAVAMLATILPMNTAMVALGEDEEPPVTVEAPAAETPEESEPSSAPEDLPEPEVTDEVPEEEPDEEPAEEPKDEDEPDVDDEPTTDAPVVDEPTTDDEPEEPFTATVVIKLENEDDIYFGDLVTLRAKVEANADYTVVWEYLEENPEDSDEPTWIECGEGDTYKFIVNEENALLTYRAVVNGEVVSEEFMLTDVKEPEADETTEEPSEEPEDETTEEPSEEPADETTEEPSEEPEDETTEEPSEEPEDETTEEPVVDPEELLDPERRIDISVKMKDEIYYGDTVTLVARLSGYENAVYTVQWQTSQDGENWTDIEGAMEMTYAFTVTEDNLLDYWRLVVNLTGVMVEEE